MDPLLVLFTVCALPMKWRDVSEYSLAHTRSRTHARTVTSGRVGERSNLLSLQTQHRVKNVVEILFFLFIFLSVFFRILATTAARLSIVVIMGQHSYHSTSTKKEGDRQRHIRRTTRLSWGCYNSCRRPRAAQEPTREIERERKINSSRATRV